MPTPPRTWSRRTGIQLNILLAFPERESSATHHLRLTSILVQLVQRRLRWFGHATRGPNGELIKDLLLPTSPSAWRRQTGGQLKTWATKADLEPLSGPRIFGYTRWRKDCVKVSSELAQCRRAWGASIRDLVNCIGDVGLTRPG